MKNKLILALLLAGLFLSNKIHAAGECLGYSGSIVDFISFPAGSSCPEVTSKTVSGAECELVKTGTFLCSIFEDGSSTISGPWRYTGNPFGGDTSEPDPTSPPFSIPQPVSVPYQENVPLSVTDFSQKMTSALTTLSSNQKSLSLESQSNKFQILGVMGQYNDQMANRVVSVRDNVLGLRDYVTQLDIRQAVKNDVSFQKVYDKQDLAQESLDSLSTTFEDLNLSASLQNIEANIGGFYNELNLVQIGQSQSATRETQINSKTDAIRNISSSAYNVSLDNRSSLQYLSSDVYDLKYQIAEISDLLQDDNSPPCGGTFDPPCEPCGGTFDPPCDSDSGDTGGSFSTLDSQNLQTVADSSLDTVQSVRSVGRGIDNVENSLDDLLTELTAIKGALENGSSEYDDTEINEKLTALINNTGTTGDNVVISAQATQNAIDATGQKVTDAVNQLGDAFEVGSGQKTGPTLCTGDDCYKGKSWITPKYPEGITSIYEDHKVKFQSSSIHEYMQGFVPNLSGSAPNQWEFCINFDGMANLGCHTVELPPYIISFVRLIILISAGFLCRRLIFGG